MRKVKKGRYYKSLYSSEKVKCVGLGFAEDECFVYYLFNDGRYGDCRIRDFHSKFHLVPNLFDQLKLLFVPKQKDGS